MTIKYQGLVAAPFTPFGEDGQLNLSIIPAYAKMLRRRGVVAAFICGTTGEGASLTCEEREAVAEAWMQARPEGFQVIVHVGHTSRNEACRLASHAESIEVDAISSMAPFFFKPEDTEALFDWCDAIARSAPSLPFYYYNIPSMTGVAIPARELLEFADGRIANLAGVKYTYEDMDDYRACLAIEDGKYDILFGRDELLLEGWQAGAKGAVGSTYNYASPLYVKIIEAVDSDDLQEARRLQDLSISMIDVCNSVGVSHLAASKALMPMLGVDCGPVRSPLKQMTSAQSDEMLKRLEAIGFFDFAELSLPSV
ncbi:dihydrodipicolinate synthase family protein [Coraliomargarita algicola]|uniref:Dihydrodipicolinate synthase family protein n=1 Tax=Coraliomargarita algicola TaxID=3092156 RepID=A0ABZ0RJ57_9BACT|nr:dihydrodipicolinate synthase family protein [Coraliomargarita sp. J2-16]WPJ96107.1 dihydrodipicolinate synthase family protein [Coraliomargarita sp. J2-16]